MNFETWKPVKGYESRYEVSDLGRVRSLDFRDSWGRFRKGKVLKHRLDKRGYPRVSLSVNNKSRKFRIHRLVAQGFVPNLNNKPQVNHKDGVKVNNCPNNLEWNSNKENAQHAVATGLWEYKTAKESRAYKSPVKVFDMDDNYLYSLHGNAGMREAGFDYRLVSAVCLGKRKSHGGHKFRRGSHDKGS